MVKSLSDIQEGDVLSNIIYGRMIRNNKNILLGVVGPTGSGKSYICLRIAELWYDKYFHKEFPIENICFSIEELMKRVTSGDLERGSLLILEEAGVNAGSLDFQTKIVKSFNYVLQSFRSKNIGIICNLPHFGMLSKQTRQLLHMLLQTQGVNKTEQKSYVKPFNLQVNQQTGKVYQHYPQVMIGGYYEKVERLTYLIPSEPLRDKYEANKEVFVDNLAQEVLEVAKRGNKKPLTDFQYRIQTEEAKFEKEHGRIPKHVELSKIMDATQGKICQNRQYIQRKGYKPGEMA